MWDQWQIHWRAQKKNNITKLLQILYNYWTCSKKHDWETNPIKPTRSLIEGFLVILPQQTQTLLWNHQVWVSRSESRQNIISISSLVWLFLLKYMYMFGLCTIHLLFIKGLPKNWQRRIKFVVFLPEWPDNLQEWQFLEQGRRKTGGRIECQKEQVETLHLYHPCCIK